MGTRKRPWKRQGKAGRNYRNYLEECDRQAQALKGKKKGKVKRGR